MYSKQHRYTYRAESEEESIQKLIGAGWRKHLRTAGHKKPLHLTQDHTGTAWRCERRSLLVFEVLEQLLGDGCGPYKRAARLIAA